jgi:arginine N-succinyltransferase
MSYAEADLLSSENKSFVRDLFPSGMIYASLLSPEAQSVVGKVGMQTRGVEKMLRRIGFRYARRIDPFDGGPHFVANADEVTPITETLTATLAPGTVPATAPRVLAARDLSDAPYFRAVPTRALVDRDSAVLPNDALEALALGTGESVALLPMP